MATTSNTSKHEIADAVRYAISLSKRIKEECRKSIDEAHISIEEKLPEIVASMNIMELVSFEYRRDELIVHVKI